MIRDNAVRNTMWSDDFRQKFKLLKGPKKGEIEIRNERIYTISQPQPK